MDLSFCFLTSNVKKLHMAPINLIFASDENFLKYTSVTLVSILKNISDERRLDVYILTDAPLSAEQLRKIDELQVIREFGIRNLIVDASQFAKIKTTPGISLATYFRLVMHDVLPLDMHRCLYMDSDIIVRKSIHEIYDMDLNGCLFAGVQDSISRTYNRKFGSPNDAPHINAGVTLVNLQLARELAFSDRVNEYLDANRYLITLGDQQIINGAFHSQIKYLPAKWNVHGSMFISDWRRKHVGVSNSFAGNEIREAASDPAAIHYTFKRKPWISMEHPRASEWWEYAYMTPFFKKGDGASRSIRAASTTNKTVKEPSMAKRKTSLTSRLNGYLRSIARLRETRLSVQRMEREVYGSSSSISAGSPGTPYHLLEEQSANLLAAIGARRLPDDFDAKEIVTKRSEYGRLFTNGENKDLNGGFHENLKTILKTPDIRRDLDLSETDGVLVMIQRLRNSFYWKALYAARYYQKDILFAETSFFGAFATYFDEHAPPVLRKSFGYILDDMGYYFDARNPSRLETHLNSHGSVLDVDRAERARQIINRIIANGITKYNFNSSPRKAITLPAGSVLVIDQKANDASIEFAAATSKTFEIMIKAALDENPKAKVFLKPHPDNMGKNRHDLDRRINVLPDGCCLTEVLDQCEKVYVVSSQVGFEGVLRGKEVHCFGLPFYAGWGLTRDRQSLPRRVRRVTVEELFYAACIKHSVYLNPRSGSLMEIEDAIDFIVAERAAAQGGDT